MCSQDISKDKDKKAGPDAAGPTYWRCLFPYFAGDDKSFQGFVVDFVLLLSALLIVGLFFAFLRYWYLCMFYKLMP